MIGPIGYIRSRWAASSSVEGSSSNGVVAQGSISRDRISTSQSWGEWALSGVAQAWGNMRRLCAKLYGFIFGKSTVVAAQNGRAPSASPNDEARRPEEASAAERRRKKGRKKGQVILRFGSSISRK